ncbi:mitochondrial intermembrane space protein mia40 [Niveomyces insectorum RCEF 264]|uniref:Mitochondrial intermembrane space import and assembly protein 40 n=1 Tax=Niveomyces insectorum RCEF 264 TaxID=1081102 RepID=A0A167Z4Y8_9HYPO|nr:mitochondrial intermembrane space protein mia40 [Niveomyces insectorum RCEF 264]
MYRAALRSSPAHIVRAVRQPVVSGGARRQLTTAARRSGTWKGSLARWGVAIGALYWYNTSPIFADEAIRPYVSASTTTDEAELPTVDALLEEKHRQEAEKKAKAEAAEKKAAQKAAQKAAAPASADARSTANEATTTTTNPGNEAPLGDAQSPEALEEEASQQGAFNPETGEINWDCPCLGGMAHGPCGEDFKAAFSCFVFSEEEPKGMDCIEKFQHMQDCFRKYPEVYGAELADDEQEGDNDNGEQQPQQPVPVEGVAAADAASPAAADEIAVSAAQRSPGKAAPAAPAPAEKAPADKEPAEETASQEDKPHSDGLDGSVFPAVAFDATSANQPKQK